jgi:hypothetical protein
LPCRTGEAVVVPAPRTSEEQLVAAVWAILAVVGVFSVLNLIEYRRID